MNNKDYKNLQHLYDSDYDVTVDYNSIVNRAINNRNISIATCLLTGIFSGVAFTFTRDNVLNGLDVFTMGTGATSIISLGAAILEQTTINKEKKRMR